MPPRCGHQDELGRECGLLKGHYTLHFDRRVTVVHDYVDTSESLRRRGGSAASDRLVYERAENDALLAEERRVALIDQVQSSANCKTCFGAQHQDHCPRYREQLEARLIRTERARRQRASEVSSLEQAVADLEANQDHGSEEVRGLKRQLEQVAQQRDRLDDYARALVNQRATLSREAEQLRADVTRLSDQLLELGASLNTAREESATAWANQLEHVEDVVLVEELLRRVKEDQR